ncbi:C-type lectin fold [Trinorchestia longiramus]|nr:C-type lectin fold [Trinorchestia longiramus]
MSLAAINEKIQHQVATLVKVLALFKTLIKSHVGIALLVFVVVCVSPVVQSKRITIIRTTQVKISSKDLDDPISVTKYPNFFKLRCAAVAYRTNSTTPVFCITSDQECLVTTASLPPGYDNTNGNPPLHTCYSYVKPLIDREAAIAACGGDESNCCPSPFKEDQSLGGCVFVSGWYYPYQRYHVARQFCKSMWSTGDLYIKPPTTTAGQIMIFVGANTFQPAPTWIGGEAVPNGSTNYQWVDGSPMSSSDFGLLSPEPDKRSGTGYPGVADCIAAIPAPPPGSLVDEPCWPTLLYLCQIT